ncbi:hypothetical protein R9V16_01735, partial [Escherichia coli]
ADRNRSHWSTSKTPSYTKSVSWQHHPSRAAKSSVQIGLYAASFLANFMKRYLLAAQNKEQF